MMIEFERKLGNSCFYACAVKQTMAINAGKCQPIAKISVSERKLGSWNSEEVAEELKL